MYCFIFNFLLLKALDLFLDGAVSVAGFLRLLSDFRLSLGATVEVKKQASEEIFPLLD